MFSYISWNPLLSEILMISSGFLNPRNVRSSLLPESRLAQSDKVLGIATAMHVNMMQKPYAALSASSPCGSIKVINASPTPRNFLVVAFTSSFFKCVYIKPCSKGRELSKMTKRQRLNLEKTTDSVLVRSKSNIPSSRANISGRSPDVVVSTDRVSLSVYTDSLLLNNDLTGLILGLFLNSFGKYFNKRGANRPNPIEQAHRKLIAISIHRLSFMGSSQT